MLFMSSNVYFSKNLDTEFLTKVDELLKDWSGRIAVKIHFGEPGNKTSFNPEDIKPIVDILKKKNIDFFLFDSSVAYNSPRNNSFDHKNHALDKGFGKLGDIITDDDFVDVKFNKNNYEVCKPLVDADGVIVISHFKGHICAGFGGAIKNLGMGCLSKNSKKKIHSGGTPKIVKHCLACKKCIPSCPVKAITVTDKINIGNCISCSNCIYTCPHGVLAPIDNYFDYLLAEGATAAKSKFKKSLFINYAVNITERCDCEVHGGNILCDDLGYFLCEDPVAIDFACYKAAKKKSGEDPFVKVNKKSGLHQVGYAEKTGLGSKDYNFIQLTELNKENDSKNSS